MRVSNAIQSVDRIVGYEATRREKQNSAQYGAVEGRFSWTQPWLETVLIQRDPGGYVRIKINRIEIVLVANSRC